MSSAQGDDARAWAATVTMTPEERAQRYAAGRAAVRDNQLPTAIEHFGDVLEALRAEHGDLALECADLYYRLGTSFLYMAQDSSDMFGDEDVAVRVGQAAAVKGISGATLQDDDDGADGDVSKGAGTKVGEKIAGISEAGREEGAEAPQAPQAGGEESSGVVPAPEVTTVASGAAPSTDERSPSCEEDIDAATAAAIAAAVAEDISEEEEGEEEEDDGEEEEEEEEDGGEAGPPPNSLQLAWENLETARLIWRRAVDGQGASSSSAPPPPGSHRRQLADCLGALGDVAVESEDFARAAGDYEQALQTLGEDSREEGVEGGASGRASGEPGGVGGGAAGAPSPAPQRPLRRLVAELLFKRSTALQWLDQPREALRNVREAERELRKHVSETRVAARGDKEKEAAAAREADDIAALLEDLEAKREELEAAALANASTKDMVKEAFEAMSRGLASTGGTGPSGSGAAGGGPGPRGFDKPSGLFGGAPAAPGSLFSPEALARARAASDSSKGAAEGASSAPGREEVGAEGLLAPHSAPSVATVQDLGTVGRGRKRLVLQPTSAGNERPSEGEGASKRVKADGAGREAAEAGTPAPAQAPAPSLPAFLQPANVKAAYGAEGGGGE